MTVGARDVLAIDAAIRRERCVCERSLPARARDITQEEEWVECLKCGRLIDEARSVKL